MHELNAIIKPWDTENLNIALVYPNEYSAMAGLTIQVLYHLWNQIPGVNCERFFMPSPELGDEPRAKNVSERLSGFRPGQRLPPRRSLENHMPLTEFDVIAFTVCYELDYANVCWMLDNAKIPFHRAARSQNSLSNGSAGLSVSEDWGGFPLVIAGGPALRANPLPLSAYMDAIYIGELEPSNNAFVQGCIVAKAQRKDPNIPFNDTTLRSLTQVPGFWIPGIHSVTPAAPIPRVYASELDLCAHPVRQIRSIFDASEPSHLPFGDAVYIEVNRGCPHTCRFCMTGAQAKPFRNRSFDSVCHLIDEAIQQSGTRRVVLIGASVTDHPQFIQICEFMVERQLEFTIPSVRVEDITSKLAGLLVEGGMRTVTIAPETGTDALRQRVSKGFTNQQVIDGCHRLIDAGVSNIKAYFLFGLPGESDDDLKAIPGLAKSIASLGYGKQAVRISLNPFIPKAQTPFEGYIDMYLDPRMPELERRLGLIQFPLKGDRQIRFETLSLQEAYLQAIISLGGQECADLIEDWYILGLSPEGYVRRIRQQKSPWFSRIQSQLQAVRDMGFGQRPWDRVCRSANVEFNANEFQKACNNKKKNA